VPLFLGKLDASTVSQGCKAPEKKREHIWERQTKESKWRRLCANSVRGLVARRVSRVSKSGSFIVVATRRSAAKVSDLPFIFRGDVL